MTEEQEKQESQKTLVAFVAGLLIGGLLVWVFGGSPETNKEQDHDNDTETAVEMDDDSEKMDAEDDDTSVSETNTEVTTPKMETGEGDASVTGQTAGMKVTLDSATFPTSEGWIGVRSFPNGQLGSILGAARYSEEQGLIPTEIELLAPTISGRTYAITFFTEDGDRIFNPAYDVQIDTEITTFVAQ